MTATPPPDAPAGAASTSTYPYAYNNPNNPNNPANGTANLAQTTAPASGTDAEKVAQALEQYAQAYRAPGGFDGTAVQGASMTLAAFGWGLPSGKAAGAPEETGLAAKTFEASEVAQLHKAIQDAHTSIDSQVAKGVKSLEAGVKDAQGIAVREAVVVEHSALADIKSALNRIATLLHLKK